MGTIQTAAELAAACKDVAQNYKTLYVMGCFGAPMNAANKTRYTGNHSYNRRTARKSMIRAADADTFGFDCAGLIKGLLWGWAGDAAKIYGGARYGANNVPDLGANQMIQKCSGISTDFSDIQVGEVVWMEDHIGVYIGDGLAVECAPAWKNGVQITAVHNVGKQAGYNGRKWVKHGKLPYVTYWAKPVEPVNKIETEEEDDMTQEKFNEMMDNWLEHQAQQQPAGWSGEAREWAERNGIVNGDGSGRMMYRKPCTREELVQILYNMAHQ